MNIYDIGDQVRLSGTFQDSALAYIDPVGVIFKVRQPNRTLTDYVYGVDQAVVKDSVGHYHFDLSLTESGYWAYRWEGTDSPQVAVENVLSVRMSRF